MCRNNDQGFVCLYLCGSVRLFLGEMEELTCEGKAISVTAESKLDPGFAIFFHWCKDNDVPVVIVSRYGYAISPYSCVGCHPSHIPADHSLLSISRRVAVGWSHSSGLCSPNSSERKMRRR